MAGNFFLHPLRILVGKVEGTPGTLETLTSADFDVRVRNPEVSVTVEMDDEASKWARGDHGEDDVVTGSQSGQITFSVRCTKASAVTTTPNWWKFANGCGALTVAYGTSGRSLQPRKSEDEKTMTLYIYDIQRGSTPAAVCYKFAGCMGNMVLAAEGVGKPWTATFTFTGKCVDVDMNIANGAILSAITAETTCGEKFLNNDCWIGTHEEKISQFSLDVGNEIQPIIDQSDATGYLYHGITSRKPRLSFNPLLTSGHDVYGGIAQGVTGCPAIQAVMVGDTGIGGRYSLHVPKGQILSPGLANREGLVNWDLNVKCLANGVTGSIASGDLAPEVAWELLLGQRS